MSWNEVRVSSVHELTAKLHKLADPLNRCICRGHANSEWRLQPSLDRGFRRPSEYSEWLDEERRLEQRFREGVEFLLGDVETQFVQQSRQDDRILRMTVMQHYGAPTRLLDWSMSPFVAAFFAAIGLWDSDGVVWWYREATFHEAADQQWRNLGINPAELDYNRFTFEDPGRGFIGPVHFRIPFPRAAAQQGLFTIAGRLGAFHDELLQTLLPPGSFGRITIPSELKRDATRALTMMNITASSLQHVGADRLGFQMSDRLRTMRSERR